MHRFYLPPEQCHDKALELTGAEAHHALHVLRVRPSDRVVVLNGAGCVFACDVTECGRDRVGLQIVESKSVPPPGCLITLIQAVPRGKIFEAIIQKAIELGVAKIVALLSARVVTQLDHRDASRRADKWQGVAIEAIKQCGAAWLPKVEQPMTPEQFLARREQFDLPLIASLEDGSRHARKYFDQFRAAHKRRPESICIWVGPEGDFTTEETSAIRAAGGLPISLGPLVLRSETAATYCLSIINHELRAS